MPRRHGKDGRLYVALTSGGTAEPVAFLNSWTINFTTDKEDVTAFGDTNKVKVAGLPDATGSYAGFWDSEAADLYTAATDGVARKFYLYPSRRLDQADFWSGEAYFDYSASASATGSVDVSGSFEASTDVTRGTG